MQAAFRLLLIGWIVSACPFVNAAETALAEPYPHGQWRSLPFEEKARFGVTFSHILVRHEDVTPGVVSFDEGEWRPAPPPPRRTREAAFKLASQISEQLKQRPSAFPILARELSEDIKTRDLGGSVGLKFVADLESYSRIVDALAALRSGEVSRPIESTCGFHILMRRQPPAAATVTGARIVINYDQAPWLRSFLARREIPVRSRVEALAIAGSVLERARAGERFEELVETFSEHEEALRHGDFGTWSTQERTPYSRQVELLSGMKVGELASPLDTPFGIEIIKRTQNPVRREFAMALIRQQYATAMLPGLPPKEEIAATMQRVAREASAKPAGFERLQKQYCCVNDTEQWTEGRGSAAAEQALEALKIGQVAAAAVEMGGGFAVIKRIAPKPASQPQVSFELR